MTKTILISYTSSVFMAVVLMAAGVMTVHASEVTGTLSSDTTNGSQTSGNVGGSVSSGGSLAGTVSGGGSSGGGGGSSGGSSSNTPPGSVLGAATNNTPAPGFPNAGFAPLEASADATLWSTVMNFLRSAVSF